MTAVLGLLLVTAVRAGIPGISGEIASSNIQQQLEDEAQRYLWKFGYFAPSKSKQISTKTSELTKQDFQDALQRFQASFLMYPSGVVDVPTVVKMNEYRCANADLSKGEMIPALKKSDLWSKKILTWNVTSMPVTLTAAQVRGASVEAFEKWRIATGIVFNEVHDENKADVVISFEDAPNNLLNIAASGSKPIKSRIYLDKNQLWAYRDHLLRGISLFHTLLHEIGHTLGLSHNFYRGSIMHPIFKPALLPFGTLDGVPNTDRLAIRRLYGLGQDVQTTAETQGRPSKCPKLVDSVVAVNDQEWLLFRDNKVWTLRNRKFVDEGKSIQSVFPRGPQFVNATVSSNGKILLFVERTIYGYTFDGVTFTESDGYPKELHDRVLFYPQAAFPLNNGSVILLSGNVFATYDVEQNAPSFLNDKQRFFPNLPEDLKSGVQKRIDIDDAYWMFDEATVSDYDMVSKQVLQLQNVETFLNCT
ncbi:unnamed protein product [Caenorhabditis auriculariae]|uniref:Peptidase metallopeptidase domain-containing protein n=1 Tax=Caenorhabditis auriculariae TaxID=2777116 RepID=A0A8S1HMP7_9PELO|nr:unnamed protein product [Caenorhabditis auriculariae]